MFAPFLSPAPPSPLLSFNRFSHISPPSCIPAAGNLLDFALLLLLIQLVISVIFEEENAPTALGFALILIANLFFFFVFVAIDLRL